MAASIASARVIIPSSTDGKGQDQDGIHGLHLLSTVVDTFLHLGSVKTQYNPNTIPIGFRHYGVPRVSTCSAPTDDTFSTRKYPYSSLQEKARNNARRVRAYRPKGSTFRSAVVANRSNMASHFSPAITVGTEGLKLVRPNLVPPSPRPHFQEFARDQKYPALHSHEFFKQQAQGLPNEEAVAISMNQKHNITTLCSPPGKRNKSGTESCCVPEVKKIPVAVFNTNGERAFSKKSMAELNYIKHKAVPMREKWMARFSELAEFKEKYGHTKVPHNFPDSPKLAEWQVRCADFFVYSF